MFGFSRYSQKMIAIISWIQIEFHIYVYIHGSVCGMSIYDYNSSIICISILWWLATKMCNEWANIIVLNLSLGSSFKSAECSNLKQLDDWNYNNQSYRHNNINIIFSSYCNFNHYNFFCQKLFLILFLY